MHNRAHLASGARLSDRFGADGVSKPPVSEFVLIVADFVVAVADPQDVTGVHFLFSNGVRVDFRFERAGEVPDVPPRSTEQQLAVDCCNVHRMDHKVAQTVVSDENAFIVKIDRAA